jgi:hypothetical protein
LVRALEAELELRKNAANGVQGLLEDAAKVRARAEKAESALDELTEPFDDAIPHVSTPGSPFHLVWSFLRKLRDAEARVKELEDVLRGKIGRLPLALRGEDHG